MVRSLFVSTDDGMLGLDPGSTAHDDRLVVFQRKGGPFCVILRWVGVGKTFVGTTSVPALYESDSNAGRVQTDSFYGYRESGGLAQL